MAQQINLCTPILLTQKRYFSAHTMAIALGVFFVLGVGMAAAWLWNLEQGSAAFAQTGVAQARELDSLKAAIAQSRASAAPADPALLAQLQTQRSALAQREKLREALKDGMFRPGWGHSDRLTWVARSIPSQVWVTEVRMDGTRFEVSGFTLEPSALNEWVDQLALSPLMQGLRLSTVKVDNATASTPPAASAPASAASAPSAPPRATWAFQLASVESVVPNRDATTSNSGIKP